MPNNDLPIYRWQYRVVAFNIPQGRITVSQYAVDGTAIEETPISSDPVQGGEELRRYIAQLGLEGWELAGFQNAQTIFFKRATET